MEWDNSTERSLNDTELLSSSIAARIQIDTTCNETETLDGGCKSLWDDLLCWPPTPAGKAVVLHCPRERSFNASFFVQRTCLSGKWGPANYVECFSLPYREYRKTLQYHLSALSRISLLGYSTSLLLLIMAFFLLASLKRLRCARNRLHLHLFASFIVRCTVLVFKHLYFKSGVTSFTTSEYVTCRLFTLLFHYSLMANYCWILMEGLYLYNIIFMAVYADNSKIAKYVIMGWGLPLPWVIIWAVARFFYDNYRCWMEVKHRVITWILRGPISLSIVLNFFFFLNITRVLFVKMSATHIPDARRVRYRKWFKSTLVLIPLFGVHQILTLIVSLLQNDEFGGQMEFIWLYVEVVFNTFQGSVVALLYCFLNNEVQSEVVRLLPERLRRAIPTGDGQNHSPPDSSKRDSLAPNACTFKVHGKRRLLRRVSTAHTTTLREEIEQCTVHRNGNTPAHDRIPEAVHLNGDSHV